MSPGSLFCRFSEDDLNSALVLVLMKSPVGMLTN